MPSSRSRAWPISSLKAVISNCAVWSETIRRTNRVRSVTRSCLLAIDAGQLEPTALAATCAQPVAGDHAQALQRGAVAVERMGREIEAQHVELHLQPLQRRPVLERRAVSAAAPAPAPLPPNRLTWRSRPPRPRGCGIAQEQLGRRRPPGAGWAPACPGHRPGSRLSRSRLLITRVPSRAIRSYTSRNGPLAPHAPRPAASMAAAPTPLIAASA